MTQPVPTQTALERWHEVASGGSKPEALAAILHEDGLITDFKVMIRPLKAVNKVWEMMGAQLQKS